MKGVKGFQKGHKHTEETKQKIGSANRGVWIKFKCDYCKKENEEKESHYRRRNKHFCNMRCYSLYRKEKMDFTQQPNYKGIRKMGDNRQIYHKRYVKKNPDVIAHLKSRRYARERGATGSHTLDQWEQLKDSYGNKCAFCNQTKKLTKDHIIPLSKGGTDYIENIQPLCKNCNSKKWNFIYENPELLEVK